MTNGKMKMTTKNDCDCEDKSQCWEPCGLLGNDEAHVGDYVTIGPPKIPPVRSIRHTAVQNPSEEDYEEYKKDVAKEKKDEATLHRIARYEYLYTRKRDRKSEDD